MPYKDTNARREANRRYAEAHREEIRERARARYYANLDENRRKKRESALKSYYRNLHENRKKARERKRQSHAKDRFINSISYAKQLLKDGTKGLDIPLELAQAKLWQIKIKRMLDDCGYSSRSIKQAASPTSRRALNENERRAYKNDWYRRNSARLSLKAKEKRKSPGWVANKAARDREYRQKNAQRLAEIKKAYCALNRDLVARRKKAWQQRHRDEIAARRKAYYEANKNEIAARRKAYYEANKDRLNEIRRTNRKSTKKRT